MKEELTAVRKLIEQGWTQGHYARNAEGDVADLMDNDACTFCLRGAIYRVTGYDEGKYLPIIQLLNSRVYSFPGIINWNDAPGRTKAEVLDLIDETLETLP